MTPVHAPTVPVVLLSGVDPAAVASAMVSLQFDLPAAVAVSHSIDAGRQLLTRTVSDVTGVIEHEEITLEHACVGCALREDVLPTLARVARDGRWRSIVVHLPIGAAAGQVCSVLARDRGLASLLHVACVVTALDGDTVVDDLLGDSLLVERGLHSSTEDVRGVGEVACAMVEYADVVAVTARPTAEALDLVRVLARPGAEVVLGTSGLDGPALVARRQELAATAAWSADLRDADRSDADRPDAGADVRDTEQRTPQPGRAWTVELRSERAFHPGRLLAGLSALGGGRHRSRGCFWLPTRPGRALAWDGSGGQLSVGSGTPWGARRPETRLLLTGVGTPPAHLHAAFARMLLTPGESVIGGSDGFEAWLGPIREAA